MCYQSFLTSSRQNIIVYTLKQNKKYFLRFQKLNAFVSKLKIYEPAKCRYGYLSITFCGVSATEFFPRSLYLLAQPHTKIDG